MKNVNEFLSTSDAARLLNRASDTVRYYERTGKLEAIRTHGGMRLFRLEDVEKFAAEQKAKLARNRTRQE